MITDQIKQQISSYLDGELSSQERQDIENLLAANPECRAYYDSLRHLQRAMHTVPRQPLSLDAQLTIEKQIAKERNMKLTPIRPLTAVLSVILIMAVSISIIYHRLMQQGESGKVEYVQNITPTAVAINLANQKVLASAKALTSNVKGKMAYEGYYLTKNASGIAVHEGYQTTSYSPDSRSTSFLGRDSYVAYNQVDYNTEEYGLIDENAFRLAKDNALSTFSIDVDTASYSNVRRFLVANKMPPKDAVRIEEMINYFSYQYPQPTDDKPFSITQDMAICPWNKAHQLLRIGLKGKIPAQPTDLPASNLVFLIDVSGSMASQDKLPLLQQGLKMMVNHLRDKDQVAMVVYAGSAGLVLPPTSGVQKEKINAAIDQLMAGGSTAGGEGIRLAYETAKQHFIQGGNNRVILATDGDFNVGVSDTAQLTRLIEEKRKDNVFLTVLGFGQGNLKDNRMESLADHGNGNYYYIDTIKEARKVLVEELGSTLFTIAKDVKIQIEFNPKYVSSYRLIGYENRVLAKEDFNNDAKDAGEIGAGHTVTALYEIVPVEAALNVSSADALKYQQIQVVDSSEVMTIKLRYKDPNSDTSKLITQVLTSDQIKQLQEPVGDFAWAAAVAEFGMLLRDSELKKDANYDHVLNTARGLLSHDPQGLRQEFVTLVETAKAIAPTQQAGSMGFKE